MGNSSECFAETLMCGLISAVCLVALRTQKKKKVFRETKITQSRSEEMNRRPTFPETDFICYFSSYHVIMSRFLASFQR